MSDNPLFRPSFEQILGHKSEADFESERLCRLEDAIIDYLLQHLDLGGFGSAVLRESGDGFRTMVGMHRIFPGFPIHLFARQFKKLDTDVTIRRIYEQFVLTKPFKEWGITEEDVPDGFDGHRGVAFLWPYMKQSKTKQGGVLVLHDYPASDTEVTGTRTTFKSDEGDIWYLETLARLTVVLAVNRVGERCAEDYKD